MPFQLHSTPEQHGQIVNQSKKSEINLHVEVVGHSEQLKLSVIEYVLLLVKNYKPESQPPICYPVVALVETDVMEDTQIPWSYF